MVTFYTKDGEELEADTDLVVKHSQVVKDVVGVDSEGIIPVPDCESKWLRKWIEWCELSDKCQTGQEVDTLVESFINPLDLVELIRMCEVAHYLAFPEKNESEDEDPVHRNIFSYLSMRIKDIAIGDGTKTIEQACEDAGICKTCRSPGNGDQKCPCGKYYIGISEEQEKNIKTIKPYEEWIAENPDAFNTQN